MLQRPHFFPKDKPRSVAQTAHCVRIIFTEAAAGAADLAQHARAVRAETRTKRPKRRALANASLGTDQRHGRSLPSPITISKPAPEMQIAARLWAAPKHQTQQR